MKFIIYDKEAKKALCKPSAKKKIEATRLYKITVLESGDFGDIVQVDKI